jgi:hypothetical protein
MDLSVSPDLDARWCYLIVLLCGLISARSQLYKRFVDFKVSGAWLVPSTWLIFGIYLAIPIALFWLMDRMNALNDTSFFAALLVGLAYPAILAGGFGGLKASAGVQDVFKPIEAFTDSVIKSVTKATARNDKRFEDFVVAQMRADKEVFDEVLNLAKSAVADVAALEKQLNDLESAGTTDSSLLLQKKARLIYLHLSGTPDFVRSLTKSEKVMKGRFWKSPIFQTRAVVGLMIFVFAAGLLAAVYLTTRPSFSIRYYGWRLTKPNSSEADRFRARENLRRSVVDSDMGMRTYQCLARLLRSPGLPVQRVDMLLQVLLQGRNQKYHNAMLCSELIDDLRVDSVDARSRVHQTLEFLALKIDPRFKDNQKELDQWNPSKGDSIVSVEDWINRWRAFFCETSQSTTPAKP